MRLSRSQAAKLVNAALSTLWERRPFKWDLAKFEGEEPELWKEMMQTMQDDVVWAASKLRLRRTKRKKTMKTGTRVRMTEEFKRNARGQCQGPGKHVGHGPSWVPDPEMPDDGCAACSWGHIDEFGECEGLVEDLMFPDDPTSEFVNVRWQPSGLRYGYHPNSLEVVPT